MPAGADPPYALYAHIPFCERKCAYCDFNSYAGLPGLHADLADCLAREIAQSPQAGAAVQTVFVGGGTPTVLAPGALAGLLEAVRETFDLQPDAEVTCEANPNSSDAARFGALRQAGFNRVSIGLQSLDDRLLRALGRLHTASEGADAVRAARSAGFRNVSVDLMYGLPGQTRADWAETLDAAAALAPDHVSAYALTLEPGTPMHAQHAAGRLALPPEEDTLWMLEHAIHRLGAAGLEHYEISNLARPGLRCRHNLVYWRNEPYLGFGPGAVSYADGVRSSRVRAPQAYIAAVREGRSTVADAERPTAEQSLTETLITGLRLREGIALDRLRARHGEDALRRLEGPLSRLRRRGMLDVSDTTVALTHRGMLFADDVFVALMP